MSTVEELDAEVLEQVEAARTTNLDSVFNRVLPEKPAVVVKSTSTTTVKSKTPTGLGASIVELLKTEGTSMKCSEIAERLNVPSKMIADKCYALIGGVPESDHSVGAEAARANAPLIKVAKGTYQYKGGNNV